MDTDKPNEKRAEGQKAPQTPKTPSAPRMSALEKQFILNATSPKPAEEEALEREARTKEEPKQGAAAGKDRFEQIREKVKQEAEEEHSKTVQSKKTIIAPLRTYKDDVARAIRRQQVSLISVFSAESRRRAGSPSSAKEGTSQAAKRVIAASVVLFVIGSASLFVFYLISKKGSGPEPTDIPSFIFTEDQREIDITGKNRTAILRVFANEGGKVDAPLGSLLQFYLTEEAAGGRRFVSARDFLSRIEARAPDSLLRAMRQDMTIGIHAVSGNPPYFVFKVDSFENAFAGMLAWERDVLEDLAPILGGTARERQGGSAVFSIGSAFEDKVIKNKDARVLRANDAEIMLLYSFTDKETIVITTNESTFNEVSSRLAASRF